MGTLGQQCNAHHQHLKNVVELGILVRVDRLAAIGRVQG